MPPKAPPSPGEEIRRRERSMRRAATTAEHRAGDRQCLAVLDVHASGFVFVFFCLSSYSYLIVQRTGLQQSVGMHRGLSPSPMLPSGLSPMLPTTMLPMLPSGLPPLLPTTMPPILPSGWSPMLPTAMHPQSGLPPMFPFAMQPAFQG